jgi:hypothetical protein
MTPVRSIAATGVVGWLAAAQAAYSPLRTSSWNSRAMWPYSGGTVMSCQRMSWTIWRACRRALTSYPFTVGRIGWLARADLDHAGHPAGQFLEHLAAERAEIGVEGDDAAVDGHGQPL